jgi:hypothetical protein
VTKESRGAVLGCVCLGLFLSALLPTVALAAKTVETTWGGRGVTGGLFNEPHDVAVLESSGDVYVADRGNNRIQRLSSDGEFELAWGRGVVAPGGTNDAGGPNEIQTITVKGNEGAFSLRARPNFTASNEETVQMPLGTGPAVVEDALEGLPSIAPGDVVVTGPAGSPWSVEFTGAYAGTDVPQMFGGTQTGDVTVGVTTTATAGVFEICTVAAECRAGGSGGLGGHLTNPVAVEVNQVTGHVYVLEADGARISEFDADGNFQRAFGWDVLPPTSVGNVPGNERQQIAVRGATGGTFRITGSPTDIPYNASAAQVREALEAMPTIAPGDVNVAGPVGGPWTIEFIGAYADVNHRGLVGDLQEGQYPNLLPDHPPPTVDFLTLEDGGRFEICEAAAECRAGAAGGIRSAERTFSPSSSKGQSAAGSGAGQLGVGSSPGSIAIHPGTGDVFVGSLFRINQYGMDGSFVRAFGWGVDSGAEQFEVCTVASGCQHAVVPPTGPDNDPFPSNGQLTSDPDGLAFAPGGLLYAATRYRPDGSDLANPELDKRFVFRFDASEATAGEILLPNPITDSTFPSACGYCVPGPLPPRNFSPGGIGFDAASIAFDPASGHLYYLSSKALLEIDPAVHPAALVDTHLPDPGIGFTGLELHKTVERLYATTFDSSVGDRIVVIGNTPGPAHVVAIKPASNVTATSATLNGEITPNGPGGVQTRYRFEYSLDGIDWVKVPIPDEAIGDGSTPVAVSQTVSGLEANLEYRVRLVAVKSLGLGTIVSPELKFTTAPLPPTVRTLFPQARTETGATLAANVNPNNSAASYRFEYGKTVAYGSTVPIPSKGLSGGRSVKVVEEIAGLEPDTTYHYRIVADNGVEEGPGDTVVEGEDVSFTTRAAIAPAAARAFEMVTPPFKVVRSPVIQGGGDGANANPGVPSLDGDTVVWSVPFFPLTEEVGWPDGGDKRILRRTGAGWVHETMNTLPVLPGVAFSFFGTQTSIGSSGDLETHGWRTVGGNTNPESGGLLPTEGPVANRAYTFRPGTGTEGFTPWLSNPSAQAIGLGATHAQYMNYDPLSDEAAFDDEGTAMARWGLYGGLAENPETEEDDDPSDDLGKQSLMGKMIYAQRSSDPDLLASAPKDLVNECTGSVDAGDASQVPVREANGTPSNFTDDTIGHAPCGAGRLVQPRGAVLGGGGSSAGSLNGPIATALSDGGERVFFTSPDPQKAVSSCTATTGPSQPKGTGTNCPPQLFVRQYGDGAPAVDWISRSRSVAGPGNSFVGPIIAGQRPAQLGAGARFQGASRDGRYVFFQTNAPLVPTDPNGGASITEGIASGASWDLYRYELPALGGDPGDGALLRVSGGPSGGADANTNPGQQAAGASARFIADDGRRVYFVTGAPIPGADATPPSGGVTSPGGAATNNSVSRNLYLYDEDESGPARYRFIAQLPAAGPLAGCASTGSSPGGGVLGNATGAALVFIDERNCFRGTPDARQVVFATSGQLSEDDDDTAGDIYLYDAEADELTRVTAPPPSAEPYTCATAAIGSSVPVASCNGDFGFSSGGVYHGTGYGGPDRGRGWGGFRYANVFRGPDGALSVVFESRSELVAADRNGDHWDVYEWREGKLSLVSRAMPGHHSYYSGNGKSGRDVFIWTTDRIDPRELDAGSYDIYDARIGGGFPFVPPPVPCDVLAQRCRGPVEDAPAAPRAASEGFTGPGNLAPRNAKCRRGQVRRKGRCIKPRRQKAHQRKKAGQRKRAGQRKKGARR